MSVTSRGRKWEILNSLWIIFTFTLGFFNWIGFLYIGYKAKYKKWIVYSIIYGLPFAIGMIWKITMFLTWLLIISGIISIVHAFIIRQEYLVRLDGVDHGKLLSDYEVKDIIVKMKLSKMNLEDIEVHETVKEDVEVKSSFNIEKEAKLEEKELPIEEIKQVTNERFKNKAIDINIASEKDLANLPSFGAILAKKAINHRETKGYFKSIEEFAETLALKPHVLERIKPLITIENLDHEHKVKDNDSSNKNKRIVDF